MRFIVLLTVTLLAVVAHGQVPPSALENYIRQTVENFRVKMKTGIPEIQMPVLDPLQIPHIPVYIKEGVADVTLMIDNLLAKDLSTFNIKSMKVDLATMTVSGVIFLPSGAAKAKYDLNGKILGFIPLYGKGDAVFGINDLEIDVKTKIDLSTGKLNLQTFAIQISFGKIQVYLENILGGGDLGDVVNQVINSFGKIIFNSQKKNLEWTLNNVIRTAVNNELAKIDLGKIGYTNDNRKLLALYQTGNANNYFDTLMKNLRPILQSKDPIALPYLKSGFKKKIGFITFEGYAELNSGSLSGISTLSRTGDVTLTTNPSTGVTTLSGNLGVFNMRVNYQTTLFFLGIRATPILLGHVQGVTVYVKVNINMKTGQKSLGDFRITHYTRPVLRITNLPVLDMMATFVVNIAMTPIANALKGTIETEVRRLIANEINKIEINI